MKHIILKKHLSFLSVIFLTQATAFANTNDNLPKRHNRDRILLLSDSVQENADVIQQYNTKIQNVLFAIPQIKEDRERDTAAQQLVQLMRSEVQEEILNALYNLEKIAESQTIPTSIRVSAIETLSEHTFPNYNINYIISRRQRSSRRNN